MKYLAILKDSLYEALDTKVFYAMFGLSCLVILFATSVSFRPVTLESEVSRDTDTLNWLIGMMRADYPDGTPKLSVIAFEQTNPDTPPWEGNYHFAVAMEFANEQGPTRRGKAGFIVPLALQKSYPYLDHVKVREGQQPDPKTVRYDVTTQGTKIKNLGEWPHEPVILWAVPLTFWHEPVGEIVRFLESWVVGFFGAAIALLLSAVITAFFIPNMLHKGTVDMLIVKPIHRSTLLIYKYIGGLAIIFLNTAFVVMGMWIVIGLRSGIWGPGFLASIFIITFQFALYYAVSTLFGVMTRSPIVAILASVLAWFLIGVVAGYGYYVINLTRVADAAAAEQQQEQQAQLKELPLDQAEKPPPPPKMRLPEWVYTTADVVHFVTPRVKDLDVLSSKLIADDALPSYSAERKLAEKRYANFSWTEAILVTSVYIVILLGIACWWFATKDY
jgi:ABC-type transport system involved in multi-copper enzyme maturation permease subunit